MQSSLNRRQFASLLAATTATTGFHCQTTPKSFADESANNTSGVCVVGVRNRGGSHIQGFLGDSRTHVSAIVDVDEAVGQKRADQIEKDQGKRPVVFADVRKALDAGGFEMLSCATPNHWHALIGVWAMQAGKDVYIEKPISHNIDEGRALVAAAEKYGRMFQTGTQCRSSDAVRDAVEFIESGGIGAVNLARGLCYKRRKSIGALGDYPVPDGVNFDLWSGPAPLTDPKLTRKQFHYDWHWQRHYGNGDSGNQGPHQTDIARWGLGVQRHPNSVISYAGRLGYKAERKDPSYVDAGDTANTQVSIYDYGDKCMVFETRGLDVSESAGPEVDALFGKAGGNKIGVIFYGTEGYLAQTSYGACTAYDLDFKEIQKFKSGNINENHFGNFIDACQARDSSILHADATVGHLSAAVAHHGNISYYLGEDNKASVDEIEKALASVKSLDDDSKTLRQTVQHLKSNGVDLDKTPLSLGPMLQFDPETERYTNNEEANKLVSRDYRDGFSVPAPESV